MKNKTTKLVKKRRLKCKTNYTKRIILLKGKCPRLVARKTNKFIILQIVESKNAQDKVIYSVNSKELLNYGWPREKQGSLKSKAAGYLSGLLLGKKAKELKSKIILDSGLIPSTKGSRIYASVKGLADSGLNIKYSEEVVPTHEQIVENIGEKIFNDVKIKLEK